MTEKLRVEREESRKRSKRRGMKDEKAQRSDDDPEEKRGEGVTKTVFVRLKRHCPS
jgi:hypothetical protein